MKITDPFEGVDRISVVQDPPTTDQSAAERPFTNEGRVLLMAGLTFHSGRRLADHPELVAAIEAAALADARARVETLPVYVPPKPEDDADRYLARAAVLEALAPR